MSPTLLTQNSFLLCLLSMPTSYDSSERDLLFVICIIKARDFFSFLKYKIMLKYWIFSFKPGLTNILLRPFDGSGLPFPSPVHHILSELSTLTHPSWVALHGMALSFIQWHRLWSMWSFWLVFCDCGFQ